jgi:hypothetical protein
MPAVHVPLPCVVYTRQVPGGGYVFSHHCEQRVVKLFPATLRTADLLNHDSRQNRCNMDRAFFLVLVAGDIAQSVSLANAGEKSRTQFLYRGSTYARPVQTTAHGGKTCSELSEHCVSLHFYGTMAVYDKNCKFHTAIPVESGVALFPRHIQESDIGLLSKWAGACMNKGLHTSVWVSDTGDSYNEHTLECSPRIKCKVF